jgi:hypothetical protein
MSRYTLETELEQFVREAASYLDIESIDLEHLTKEDISNLRAQFGIKKYIPLIPLITFLKLNIIRPDQEQYSLSDFNRFIQYFAMNDELRLMLTKQFQPPVDDSIEGDIYNQNAFRARSIVEEISNSLDANPDQIDCTIQEGFYEIKEIGGQGMSPEVIFTKYLLPKETTKGDSAKQIGRFGIGSFIKLAHLKDESEKVVIETRREGHIGCRLEYRRINREISVSMEEDDSIPLGTVTRVYSSDIHKPEYKAMLTNHLAPNIEIPILINGKPFKAKEKEYKASITIGGIVISTTTQPLENLADNVTWELPRKTTISESRNRVILDSDETRNSVLAYIKKIETMPHPQWVRYANSIAPLVKQLQASNASLNAKDNVFDALVKTVLTRLEGEQYVPDVEPYTHLASEGVLRLHPLITPKQWLDSVASKAPEFSGGETKIYLTKLIGNDDKPYLIDLDNNRIYLDETYYQQLKSTNRLNMIPLLFKYPPGEVSVSFNSVAMVEDVDGSKVEQKLSSIKYKPRTTENPLHDLYKQHGIMNLYGDDTTNAILSANPDAYNILSHAKSLVATYYTHPFYSGYNDYTIGDYLLQFRYQGKRFYYSLGVNRQNELYNDRFQKLHDPKWQLLIAKIEQLFDHHDTKVMELPEQDIDLEEDDVLLITDKKTSKKQVVNGLGELISEDYWSVKRLSKTAYVLYGSDKKRAIYDVNSKSVHTIYQDKIIPVATDPNLLVLTDANSSYAQLYDINKNATIASGKVSDFIPHTKEDAHSHGKPEIVQMNGGVAIFEPKRQTYIPLNIDASFADIGSIFERDDYYLIENKSKPKQTDNYFLVSRYMALVDKQGTVLHQGYDIRIHKTSHGDFYQVDGFLYDPMGNQLNQDKIKYFSQFEDEGAVYFILTDEADNFRLINQQGEVLKTSKSMHVYENDTPGTFKLYIDDHEAVLTTPHAIIPGARKGGANNSSYLAHQEIWVMSEGPSNLLITDHGYPVYRKFVPEYHEKLRHGVVKTKPYDGYPQGAVIAPLTPEQLSSPKVLTKLAWLNQQNLSYEQYSHCLRLIHLPLEQIKAMMPYIHLFKYTPEEKTSSEYRSIIGYVQLMSERDQVLVLSTFDLLCHILNEGCQDGISQKLIDIIEHYGMDALEQLNQDLSSNRTKLSYHMSQFESVKDLIDAMPSTSGQMAYYLLFPKERLVSNKPPLLTQVESPVQQLSLLDFMTAFQFDSSLLNTLADSPEKFIHAVESYGAYGKKGHFRRLLQHAIYHQADPNQHLYERELLQNGIDAYFAEPELNPKAKIEASVFQEGDSNVFRLQDFGVGMTLEQVFQFFCLPGASTKRSDNHQHFIGGHGVGLFTIYHNAKTVRVKCGKGDGQYYQFEFTPVYDEQDKIVDIRMSWQQLDGDFKGFAIERVERDGVPALSAARHQRTFKGHGATVDADIVKITLNDQQINQPLTPLATIAMPPFGDIKTFKSVEDKMTVAGLAMKPIGDSDAYIPSEIRDIVRKKGIIIDFPKSLPLSRDRTDFANAGEVNNLIKPYVLRAYIESYARLFLNNHLGLYELPYDFFFHFERFLYNPTLINSGIEEDAQRIMDNQPLSDYAKYESPFMLHSLIAFLPLFEASYGDKTYSLVDLAKEYNKTQVLPSLKSVPESLRRFTSFYKEEQARIEKQEEMTEESTFMKNSEWRPQDIDSTSNWGLLTAVTQLVVAKYGYPNLGVGLSTKPNGSLMYTYQSSSTIYWNAIAMISGLGETILKELITNKGKLHRGTLVNLVEVVAHELVHAQQEYPGEHTHNHAFYKKQQALILKMTKPEVLDQLVEEIEQVYQQHSSVSDELSLNDLSERPMKGHKRTASEMSMFTEQPSGGKHLRIEAKGAVNEATKHIGVAP